MSIDTEKKKDIAVIGSEEFQLGFKLAGINKTYDSKNFEQKIEELLEKPSIGILVAEEEDIQDSTKRVRKMIESSVDPVVIGLSENVESERLQEKIRKAIGADIT